MTEAASMSEQSLNRLAGHINMVQALSSMVAAELVAADGLTDAQALMAIAQGHISCGAHTAVAAAREHLQREPDQENWNKSCTEAFLRAVGKVDDLPSNVPNKPAI